MDIVIYTNPRVLAHKMGLDGDEDNGTLRYWEFRRFPRKVVDGDRMFFATKGEVRGSFEIEFSEDEAGRGRLIFWPGSWTPAPQTYNEILTTPFRGFRYRWWGGQPAQGAPRV